jgi:hypothetical protein
MLLVVKAGREGNRFFAVFLGYFGGEWVGWGMGVNLLMPKIH